ncbi:hypothetical protein FUA48_08490 [Flavobacterium alkalisoli]|uniref:Uncharacterized protein n=1 Tax=Flavobacterium alkalisoli TaxID=2602769 RepID=A0A5B9FV86_9FLAO|nr:hypothetical protein [Flavobacterium alkalisoli]QEE49618.1 hypothetical protein FUA48_08490 [Flavobacterium alkalisoli]
MKTFMKTKAIIAILFVVILASCSDPTSTNDLTTNSNLKVFQKDYKYYNYGMGDVNLKYFNINKKINSHSLILENNFQLMVEDIITSFNLAIEDFEKVSSIVFYGNNLNLTVNSNNITGFTLLKNINNSFITETYKIKNSQATLIEDLSKDYKNKIFIDVFGYITNKIDSNNNTFILVKDHPIQKSITLKDGEEENDYSLDLYLLDQFPIIFTYESASTHYCSESQCASQQSGFCTFQTDTEASECAKSSHEEDGPCPRDEWGDNPPEGDDDYTFVQSARAAMYSIRDNILSSSTKGQQYVDFYYKIGYVWKVTSAYQNNAADIKDLMDFIDRKSVLLITASSSTVIIDSSDATYLRSMIATLKNVHSNAEYQYIFTTLDNDLNTFENKTKADLLSLF